MTAGTLSGLIERLVPLPNYYPDVRFLNIYFSFFFCFLVATCIIIIISIKYIATCTLLSLVVIQCIVLYNIYY